MAKPWQFWMVLLVAANFVFLCNPSRTARSCGYADVFGASEGAKEFGMNLLKDNPIPGTPGVASLLKYVNEGCTVLSF